MASVHKKHNSRYWYCAYYLPNGQRVLRSTGSSEKSKAIAICEQISRASKKASEGRLIDKLARKAIAEIYEIGNDSELPSFSTAEYVVEWLERKQLEVSDRTYSEYEGITKDFIEYLGRDASQPMDMVTVRDVLAYRTTVAARVSGTTVNKYIKVLRSMFNQALKDGILKDNILTRIDAVKKSVSKRRAFTIDEIKSILEVCNDEWRGLVLFGFYTGQRLSDIAGLKWSSIDMQHEEIRLTTQKTDRSMIIPIPVPLFNYLESLPLPDKGQMVFPTASSVATSSLSQQFRKMLAGLGLTTQSTHKSTGQGRNTRRQTNELSFHCLRHTTTSALKNSGVSNAVAMEIIGHESEAVNRIYTHIDTASLRDAVNRLPDLT